MRTDPTRTLPGVTEATPALALVAITAVPAAAQTASMTMGNAASGEVGASMSMGAGGMSMSASTGGRSMSMDLNGGANGPGGPTTGAGNTAEPTTGTPSTPTARASSTSAIRSGGDADYRQCLRRAERANGAKRDRVLRRCRGLR